MAASSVYLPGKWQSSTFTSDGSFTVPARVDMVFVEMCGGGGGGASASGISYGAIYGGEAGQLYSGPVSVNPGDVLTVDIGGGGSAGSDGQDTSFGSKVAGGGKGGGVISESTGGVEQVSFTSIKGTGVGRQGFGGNGGGSDTSGSGTVIVFGGDGCISNGGNGNASGAGSNGSLGGGGGGSLSSTGGSGGSGYCKVYWRLD